MKPEFSKQRRFLLFGILPISVMMIALPLTPHFAPQVIEVFRDISQRKTAAVSTGASVPGLPMQLSLGDYDAPRISPSIENELRTKRRIMALDVIHRLEEEAHRKGGPPRLSAIDLKRLRNALRRPESDSNVITPIQ